MKNWFSKLKSGLNKSSTGISEGLKDVFVRKKLDDGMCEALEDTLIQADIGVETSMTIINIL